MVGIILVFLCGVRVTYEVKKGFDKRIESLTSFYEDCEYFINNISFLKTPLYQMISTLINSKRGEIKKFYKTLLEFYKTGNGELVSWCFETSNLYLNKKDKTMLGDFFENIGKQDYDEQISFLKVKSSLIKNALEEAKENKLKNEKSKCTFTMCVFVLIIILVI